MVMPIKFYQDGIINASVIALDLILNLQIGPYKGASAPICIKLKMNMYHHVELMHMQIYQNCLIYA